MSENVSLDGYLGDGFQLKCLWQLITDAEFAELTIPLLDMSYFDDPNYKRFFYVIKKHLETYGTPPSLLNRSILFSIRKFNKKTNVAEIELLDAIAVKIKNWNDMVLNKELPHDGDVIKKETVNFVRQQEYRKIASFILNGVKEGDNSDEFLHEVEERIKRISEIGDEDDMGIEVMENAVRALKKEFRKPIPTGIAGIDLVTKGGLGSGEIGIILAPSGVGKSTILSYIANTAYNHGYNVLQIIFEDTEDQIRRKHYAKWSKIPLSEIDDKSDEVYDKIVKWHEDNTYGRLVIKRFSQEETTIPKIRNYIDKYRKKHGVKFDIVILDYIDVVDSHKRGHDQNANELTIIKAFESMASDYDIPAWTAIQGNRSSYNAEFVETSQMGGNIKRAQKTHFLMSIAKTPKQKIDNQANIMILKARMAQDGHVFKDCIFDNNRMEIAITDDLSDLKRKTMNIPKVDETDVENFNKKIGALKDNEELDEYSKPDDTINREENDKPVNINIDNNNLNVGSYSPDQIDFILEQNAKNQDILKK